MKSTCHENPLMPPTTTRISQYNILGSLVIIINYYGWKLFSVQ